MLRGTPWRIGVILLFGAAASLTPGYAGWLWGLDGWLWTGVRDYFPGYEWHYLPLALSGLMIVAEGLGWLLPSCAVRVRRPLRWSLVIAGGAAVLFWSARVDRWFGDLHGIDSTSAPWWTVESAEPLGAFTSYYTHHWALAAGLRPSTAFAAVSVACGAAAAAALFLWCREVCEQWPLAFAMIASSGFMVLFCGYPEKGTPKSLALIFWYVYFGTRALREPRAVLSAAAGAVLAIAALMHGAVLCWLPAQVYAWWTSGFRRAAAGIAAFAAPLAAMAAYVRSGAPVAGGAWGNVAAPWQWFKAYCITNCGYDFFSATHALDIINCLLLLAPVAVLCLPEALARAHDVTRRWLALGAAGCLFLSVTWFPVFGYLPDWDIFTLAPLAISFLAVLVAAESLSPAAFRRLAAVWIAGSLAHTLSFWRYWQIEL